MSAVTRARHNAWFIAICVLTVLGVASCHGPDPSALPPTTELSVTILNMDGPPVVNVTIGGTQVGTVVCGGPALVLRVGSADLPPLPWTMQFEAPGTGQLGTVEQAVDSFAQGITLRDGEVLAGDFAGLGPAPDESPCSP